MKNVFLYIITVVIWGCSWYMTKLQVDLAPQMISILYRSVFSALALLSWCWIRGLSLRFSAKNHVFLFLLGATMFSVDYFFFYESLNYLLSGVVAIIISGTSFLNIVYNYLFFRQKPKLFVVLGALIGVFGLSVFFWDEVSSISLHRSTIKGLFLAGIGTLIFASSSSIVKRNNQKNLSFIPSVAMGMMYGALLVVVYTMFFSSQTLVFPRSFVYWGSLFYVAFLSSTIATLSYFKLVKNIGPEFAGYAMVLVPVIALGVSWLMEGYQWSCTDFLGFFLIILGNILVVRKKSA